MKKLKVKMGYGNAYDYLYIYVQNMKDKKLQREMANVLNDFAYCIEKTEKYNLIEDAMENIRKALSSD